MFESIGSVLHVLFAALGVAWLTDPGTATLLAVAITTLAVLALAGHVLGLPIGARPAVSRPRRAIDASVPLAQSDPDAPGHARPRAPGLAAPAA